MRWFWSMAIGLLSMGLWRAIRLWTLRVGTEYARR
jgi:hypothetical protein